MTQITQLFLDSSKELTIEEVMGCKSFVIPKSGRTVSTLLPGYSHTEFHTGGKDYLVFTRTENGWNENNSRF